MDHWSFAKNPHDTIRPIVPAADMAALAEIGALALRIETLIQSVTFVDHSEDLQDCLTSVSELKDSAGYAVRVAAADYATMVDREEVLSGVTST